MTNHSAIDIVPLLREISIGLQPLAAVRDIVVDFTSSEIEIKIKKPVSELLWAFSTLLKTLIDYVPALNLIHTSTRIYKNDGDEFISIMVRNTGINLKQVLAITNNISIPVIIHSAIPYETTYEINYALSPQLNAHHPANSNNWNYLSVIRGIQSHFSKLNNTVARLAEESPKDAAFLTIINDCIDQNMVNEFFDANALSEAIAISRAQLLRRLKSLTGASPAFYIKTMRLEKAKILLQTADLSISEIAFKTGFNSPSHFSKVFNERFGMQPSMFRRPKPNATNE